MKWEVKKAGMEAEEEWTLNVKDPEQKLTKQNPKTNKKPQTQTNKKNKTPNKNKQTKKTATRNTYKMMKKKE